MPSPTYENALTTVEWPHEDHIPAVRCPITGMVVSMGFAPEQNPATDSPMDPVDEKCPTLMFRYCYETGMEYIRPELAGAIEDRKGELVESGEFEDEADIDDLAVISDYLEDLGPAPMIIDMPTHGLPGDGIVVGLDLALAVTRISDKS